MQTEKRMNKFWVVLAGISWTAGLLIAGSESSHMPWINILGALIFFAASLVLGKILPELEISHGKAENLVKNARPAPVRIQIKKGSGFHPGYALGVMLKG